jgi:DNA replication protein DnaC
MTMSQETPTPAIVAPQVLLSNHLKALKLPTFAREYEKVAMESAQDRADYPRYLLRLCELERIDRERRNVERRIRLARFPQTKSFDTFDFAAQPSLNKALVLELTRCERETPELPCSRAIRHRNAYGLRVGISCLPEGLQCRLHDRGRPRA